MLAQSDGIARGARTTAPGPLGAGECGEYDRKGVQPRQKNHEEPFDGIDEPVGCRAANQRGLHQSHSAAQDQPRRVASRWRERKS